MSLLPVADGLWRVVARSGAVLGHIERDADGTRTGTGTGTATGTGTGTGERFAARRLLSSSRTISLGAFWTLDDAADCFR